MRGIINFDSGRIEKAKEGLYLQKDSVYYMGASSSPDQIIVTDFNKDLISYMRYPFNKTLRIERWIGEDLIITGSARQIENNESSPFKAKWMEDYTRGLKKVLDNKPAEELKVNPDDFKRVTVIAKPVGSSAEELWYKAEKYGGVGIKNDMFEIFSSKGQVKDMRKDKNFKVIKVIEE